MVVFKQILALFLCLAWSATIPAAAADVSAGEKKAETCGGCHGAKGNSTNPQWPNLAAQQSTYIINQLNAFKKGDRINPVMQPMAANLTDEDIANLAAYYSTQKKVEKNDDLALAEKGKAKAAICLGCHGASAEGNGQFPRLAGQHPEYLVQQLKSFKDGSRKGGPMAAITANLSEEDFEALAAYFGSL